MISKESKDNLKLMSGPGLIALATQFMPPGMDNLSTRIVVAFTVAVATWAVSVAVRGKHSWRLLGLMTFLLLAFTLSNALLRSSYTVELTAIGPSHEIGKVRVVERQHSDDYYNLKNEMSQDPGPDADESEVTAILRSAGKEEFNPEKDVLVIVGMLVVHFLNFLLALVVASGFLELIAQGEQTKGAEVNDMPSARATNKAEQALASQPTPEDGHSLQGGSEKLVDKSECHIEQAS